MAIDAAEKTRLHQLAEARQRVEAGRSDDERAFRALSKQELLEDIRIEIPLALKRLRLSATPSEKIIVYTHRQHYRQHRHFASRDAMINIIEWDYQNVWEIPIVGTWSAKSFWLDQNGDLVVKGSLPVDMENDAVRNAVEFHFTSESGATINPDTWVNKHQFIFDQGISWKTLWGSPYSDHNLDVLRGLLLGLRQVS